MRTTLDLDDDLLQVAREMAHRKSMTIGEVVSGLMRTALAPRPAPKMRNGVPLFTPKPGTGTPSMDLVNRLRDDE